MELFDAILSRNTLFLSRACSNPDLEIALSSAFSFSQENLLEKYIVPAVSIILSIIKYAENAGKKEFEKINKILNFIQDSSIFSIENNKKRYFDMFNGNIEKRDRK